MLGRLGRLFGPERQPSLEEALLRAADEVWEVAAKSRGEHYPPFEHPWAGSGEGRVALEVDRERRVAESFRRLLASWPEPELTRRATEMYFDSREWHDRYAWNHLRPETTRWLLPAQGRIVDYLLHRWVATHPPADLVARLRDRLHDLYRDPRAGPPTPYGGDYPYPPTMRACLELLRGLESAEATALVHDLLRGAFAEATKPDAPVGHSAFAQDFNRAAPWMLTRAWRAGLLDEALLEGIFRRQIHVLAMATRGLRYHGASNAFYEELGPEPGETVRRLTEVIVRRWAESLDSTNARLVSEVDRLEGNWSLLRAGRYVEELKLKSLPTNDYSHRGEVPAAVTRLMSGTRVAEEDEATVRALRSFQESTLLLALPIALHHQDLICRALDWDGAVEFVQLARRIARCEDADVSSDANARNSPDPTNGVVDAREVRASRARMGPKRFATLLKALGAFPTNSRNTLYLVEAAIGANRKKVIEGFGKRSQPAVRALGLLPFGDDADGSAAGDAAAMKGEQADEVLRRYVALRQFAKEAAKFGMQRQTNERAAAAAGLANLALNAGYADATRLEWAMEDLLGAELGASGREWPIDERYAVELAVGADGPDLTAYKDGVPLKSLPDAVKKHPDYEAMKEAKAELRAQARRYRTALDDAMCRGESLASGELAVLARNPAARRMLGALVFLDDADATGLFDPEAGELVDLAGARRPVAGSVRIAHPRDLYHAGLLADWQRELVRRRVVQPFKQVFRELYVVTPAEDETRVFSRRFAGQVVGSAQAARLLQAEGWDCVGEDYPRKVFGREGLAAHLSFVEGYHYMSEVESLVVDEVYFLPASGPRWWSESNDVRVALSEVPPVVFSEVMRDVDLVVSVAQYTPDPAEAVAAAAAAHHGRMPYQPSAEMIERRGDLVRELAADLGLGNVAVGGSFVRINGKLASYRLHLGSATIHIEPGAYLCVVPARWGQKHDRLFLPFDAEDLKTSEVVSKVLLLADDARIKDESILSQIRSRAAGQ